MEILRNTFSRGVVFQQPISSAVVASICEILRRTKTKPRNVQHFQFCDLTLERKPLMVAKFKGRAKREEYKFKNLIVLQLNALTQITQILAT